MVFGMLDSRGHQSFEGFLLTDKLLDRACLARLVVTDNRFANVRQAALQVSTDYGIDSVDVQNVANESFGQVEISPNVHWKGCFRSGLGCGPNPRPVSQYSRQSRS